MVQPVAYGRVAQVDVEDQKEAGEGSTGPGLPRAAATGAAPAAAASQKASPGDLQIPIIGVSLKWFVLAFLVVQNCSAMMLMRYTRGDGPAWSAQSGVILQEIMKGIASSLMLLHIDGSVGVAFEEPLEVLKTGVPAMLYLLQNNLQYIAAANIDAPTIAVLNQLKLLSTALFSVALLGRSLSRAQWLALLVLGAGISIVTLSQVEPAAERLGRPKEAQGSWATGVAAMLVSAGTSGLASAYFEKMLKGSKASMWARNLQMSMYSVTIGAVCLVTGGEWAQVLEQGFFGGYSPIVWVTISNNAIGGLLVAMAITYADSIVKNFSTSLAIVLTAILSSIVFGTVVGQLFGLGVGLVIYAVMLYGGVTRVPTCQRAELLPTQA